MTEDEKSELENAMTAPADTQKPEAELPDRWKGKSPAEIIKAHEELERKLGDQGRELGEYKAQYDTAQSQLASLRQAPPPPQTPQPKEENWDDQFFASPTKTIDSYFEKKLKEYDAQKRYVPSTLDTLKRQDPDIFGDDEIVNMTRQFVDYGIRQGQLDPMIQADPNLLTAIGVNMKYQRDKQNPNRTPVQPTQTETPAAVKTNEPTQKHVEFSDKGKSLINYLSSRAPDVGITSMKDAAELMNEEEESE
jgi:hypothetical protein